MAAVVSYGISQIGLMICFFTYNVGGAILYPLFYALNAWPLLVLQHMDGALHSNLLGVDENYSNAFYRGQFISLAGWLLISPLMLMILRRIKRRNRKKHEEG